MAAANICGALLIAGAGSRFGGHKGQAMLGGKMMAEHAAKSLADVNLAATYAVCNPDHAALCTTLEVLGLRLIANHAVDAGLSHSLGLAAQMALQTDSDALMICLGDMPFVTSTHLGSLVRVYDAAGGARAVTSMAGDVRMPPAIFPKSMFPALAKLSGDSGARGALQNALVVTTDADMLVDIDTPQDLTDAEMRMLRAR